MLGEEGGVEIFDKYLRKYWLYTRQGCNLEICKHIFLLTFEDTLLWSLENSWFRHLKNSKNWSKFDTKLGKYWPKRGGKVTKKMQIQMVRKWSQTWPKRTKYGQNIFSYVCLKLGYLANKHLHEPCIKKGTKSKLINHWPSPHAFCQKLSELTIVKWPCFYASRWVY